MTTLLITFFFKFAKTKRFTYNPPNDNPPNDNPPNKTTFVEWVLSTSNRIMEYVMSPCVTWGREGSKMSKKSVAYYLNGPFKKEYLLSANCPVGGLSFGTLSFGALSEDPRIL